MAYKFSKGEREFGDIEYEDDPEKDTKIDFDDNFIALVTSEAQSLPFQAHRLVLAPRHLLPNCNQQH